MPNRKEINITSTGQLHVICQDGVSTYRFEQTDPLMPVLMVLSAGGIENDDDVKVSKFARATVQIILEADDETIEYEQVIKNS